MRQIYTHFSFPKLGKYITKNNIILNASGFGALRFIGEGACDLDVILDLMHRGVKTFKDIEYNSNNNNKKAS